MRIAKVCVDTGGRDTASVYGHLRHLRDPRIAPTKGVEGWNRAQPVQGPTLVDALVNGQKLRRGLKLWTVSVSTWKADLYRRLWLGRGEAADFPVGWVHLPQGIEVEWVKQLVAEQLPHSDPMELVNLPPLEWLKDERSFLTLPPLHFGQVTGSFPMTRISKSLSHFSQ